MAAPKDLPQLVVCAALRNSITGEVIVGVRHWDPFMQQQIKHHPTKEGWGGPKVQGFVDQRGQFLTRSQAFTIAEANGQIRRLCGSDEATKTLTSEDLY